LPLFAGAYFQTVAIVKVLLTLPKPVVKSPTKRLGVPLANPYDQTSYNHYSAVFPPMCDFQAGLFAKLAALMES